MNYGILFLRRLKAIDTKAFHKLSYGLYVIGSVKEGLPNGQIANTVFQISSEPATIGISINKKNLTNEFIKASKVFSVSVLTQTTPLDLIGHFGFKSGRDLDKFKTVAYKQGVTGSPILSHQIVSFVEAEVVDSIEVETHTIFIGKVVNAEVINSEEPMTYAYYQQVKKGSASKVSNPTNKYKCVVCGYVYDPVQGDPDSGIAPGTSFEDIPDDWVCPICGVSKDQFEIVG